MPRFLVPCCSAASFFAIPCLSRRLARALHDQATTALAEPQDKEEAAAVLAALGAAYELLSKAKECRAVEQQQKQAAPATAGGGSGGADNAAAIMAKLLRLETKVSCQPI